MDNLITFLYLFNRLVCSDHAILVRAWLFDFLRISEAMQFEFSFKQFFVNVCYDKHYNEYHGNEKN